MKQILFWVFCLAVSGLFLASVFHAVSAAGSDIIINEIAAFEPANYEWLEIFNRGLTPINLADWKFFENNINHGLSLYQGATSTLGAGQYAIIAQVAPTFAATHPDFSGLIFDSVWSSLSESGELIGLRAPNISATATESFVYLAAPDFSLQRVNPWFDDYTAFNWQSPAAGSTAGFLNSNFNLSLSGLPLIEMSDIEGCGCSAGSATSTATAADSAVDSSVNSSADSPAGSTADSATASQSDFSAAKIVINEVLPNPIGSDELGEFIELKNLSNVSFNLTGWKLSDGSNKTYVFKGEDFSSLIIAPAGFLVIWRPISGISLNNSGAEAVILLRPDAAVADQIKYSETAAENVSYNRDSFGDWAWSETPTPGKENVFITTDDSAEEVAEITANTAEPAAKSATATKTAAKTSASAAAATAKIATKTASATEIIKTQDIVSAEPGILGTQIFYLLNSGWQVYSYKKDFPDLKLGDYVSVAGVFSETDRQGRLKTAAKEDIKVLSRGQKTEPIMVATGDIASGQAEIGGQIIGSGRLVKVSGEVLQIANKVMTLDDGSGEVEVSIKTGTQIKTTGIKAGDWLEITGITLFYQDHFRILPRYQTDMVKGAVKGETDSQATTTATTTQEFLIFGAGKNQWFYILTAIFAIAGTGLVYYRFRRQAADSMENSQDD